jgi:nucleoporin NUP159
MEEETPHLAMQDVATSPGDSLKLFAQPWPADNLPAPTASLLAVASQRRLLAAAGPDKLILAGTTTIRSQYIPRRKTKDAAKGIMQDEPKLKDFKAEVEITVPRLSHVAFSSDESCLIIVAEQGGGLACYDVNALTNGGKEPAFQIGTLGSSVRQVLPNPNPQADFTRMCAIVLQDGRLLMADLRTQSLVKGASGSEVYHQNVKSASWSKLGKQIIAGLEDSTCAQIDIQGNVKDQIPQPPQLASIKQNGEDNLYAPGLAFPVTSVYWLETHKFLLIYTPPIEQPEDPMPNHNSLYFIAQREKGTPFIFRKFDSDPCPSGFDAKRLSASHYIQRLNEWQPNLSDVLVVASSISADVGVVAQFKDQDPVCAILDENRKASLPTSYANEGDDTSPIGMALDFSAVELTPRPIPEESDTIENSPFPLPALCMLNTDGVLQMWWVIYTPSVKQTPAGGPFPFSSIVKKEPPFATYTHYAQAISDMTAAEQSSKAEIDQMLASQSPFSDAIMSAYQPSGAGTANTGSAKPAGNTGSASTFGTATSTPPATSSAIGGGSIPSSGSAFGSTSAFGGTSALGQKPSPWGASTAAPATSTFGQSAKPAFGQSTFGQPAKPAFGQASTPAFGQASTPAFGQSLAPAPSPFSQPAKAATPAQEAPSNPASPFAQATPSTPAFGKTTFGQPSAFGQASTIGGSGFGQVGQIGAAKPNPAIWGSGGPKSGDSPFASFASKGDTKQASGFASFAKQGSPFASAGQSSNQGPSAFAGAGGQASSFSGFGKSQGSQLGGFGKPSMPNDQSVGSTATIGSTPSGWTMAGGSGSSGLSREATMNSDDSSKKTTGLSGLSGFTLGSGFKGDGTAKDDLPKPKNPGAGMFGNILGDIEKKPSSPFIKAEPGTESELQLEDIPEAKPSAGASKTIEDAPLPPDPSTFKASKLPDDLPLPPDPTTFKAPSDAPLPPDFTAPNAQKSTEADVPIVGSPPLEVTNSQTFSPGAGPSDDESGFEDEEDDDEDGEEGDEDDEDVDEEDEEDDDEEGFSSEDAELDEDDTQEPYKPKDAGALANFMNRVTPPTKKSAPADKPQASYTPAGMPMPKGPVFPPPANRPILSPRSPSPQRAVTSPVARQDTRNQPLPQQIKTTSVPPAKPIDPKPVEPKEPVEPTAGELEDAAADRVKQTLNAPIEPSKDLPRFYTHQDYAGSVDKPGIGGQIEIVYRDINSMIDVVGLNARALATFIEGHTQLRESGSRTRDDLDATDAWCLGDLSDLSKVVDGIAQQLENGKLEHVASTLNVLSEEQRTMLQLKAKTVEIRKHIVTQTDSERIAAQEAASLSAETQAQQSELRQGVQRVQKLLSELEEKISLLRADLASARRPKSSSNQAPVPTVEAVTNTILKMTAMVEQRSGDIDLLESRIRSLPNGIDSLRLRDDYEDDLAARLGSSKLLTGSPSHSTPRRPRMAANGDALGMSAMFATSSALRGSRFATPPTTAANRRSVAFSPEASAFGRSTGSASGSARKKMVDVTVEEVEAFQARKGRRKDVLSKLKGRVERTGSRVVQVGDRQ